MSVPNQTPYIIYNANGLTTVFPFEFYIINSGDIQVSLNGGVITTGYSVSGVGNIGGGDVTFLTPPANGTVVMLERVVPTYRLTDYQDNGDLLADTVNKDFDRLWMAIQRSFIYLGLALRRPLFGGPYNAEGYRISNLADPVNDQDAATKKWVQQQEQTNINRTLRVPETYVDPVPFAGTRANKLLAFDSTGKPIAVLPPSGSASDVLIELAAEDGATLIGGSVYVVNSFAIAKSSNPGQSKYLITRGHTVQGIGSAKYIKDGTTGTPSSGDEIKFYDAIGNGWAMDLSDAVGIPITRLGLIPGVDTPAQATANAVTMKRGGERIFDVGLRVILPPAKFYVNDVTFSKPVGVMGFTAGLGANQTGVGGGKDGFSEWVHRGTGWAIYYEPWLRTNGSFDPDAISLTCFGLRGNIQGGAGVSLGGVKINDDSVINDETRAKRDLVMTDITISGFWSGYGLRISWCFINVLTRVKIWDCGVCYLANRANATTHFGCSIETTLQGVTVLESADFSWYGGMLEYTNASKSYHSMPSDYPVDTNWAAGVNSYKGIGFRSRGSKASFYGGYCEGSIVFFQVELNSDTILDGVRFQLGDMVANHVVRSHGGYSLTVVRCKIDGSLITGAPFYRTPSQSYIGKYFIHDNIYTSSTANPPMRPITNPTLGFQGECDIYGVATSDYPLKRFMFGKSIEAYDTLNGQNNGSTPVFLKGDLIGCRQVTVNATGATFSYDIGGTTHAVGGVVHINIPAGCAVTVSATNLSNWPEGAEVSVVPVSSGTSGSPATMTFSSTFRLAAGNDDISTTSGKRAIYTFKLMNGSLYQMGLAKSV